MMTSSLHGLEMKKREFNKIKEFLAFLHHNFIIGDCKFIKPQAITTTSSIKCI